MKKYAAIPVLFGAFAAIIISSCAKVTQSSEKSITSFSISSPAAMGQINDSAKTINIMVPRGTDVKSLIATFTFTGAKVTIGSLTQTSAVTANDFSIPVVYKVIAADNSSFSYIVTVVVQRNCLFVSSLAAPGDPRDSVVIVKLRSWKYNVTIAASSTLPTMTADTFALYDFAFLSETPNSSEYYPMKGHPLPLLNLEAWAAAKTNVLDWSSVPGAVSNYDPLTLIIADNSNSPLSAGFAFGTEFKLADSTSIVGEADIGFVPTIKNLPIATIKDGSLIDSMMIKFVLDSSIITLSGGVLTDACAVEQGTLLADGTTVAKNRAVTIGIHASAYAHLTDEAYKLIQAGIHWILKE
jgi:hypothetical protein